jgi:hypothetical protein
MLNSTVVLFDDREDLSIAEDVSRVYVSSGYKAALQRQVELRKQLAKRRYVDPADNAYGYAYAGDKEQRFAWLDKAAAKIRRTRSGESCACARSVPV